MILLAEDNDIIIDLLSEHLRQWGYGVDIATDGASAVAKAGVNDYVLIIMDIMLTGVDGVTAARAIRELSGSRGTVPIIALTGGMAHHSDAERVAARFETIVQKPILPNQLKEIVQRYARAA